MLFTGYEHPDIHHPFFQEVLVGLKHGIGELGYDLLLFATEQPGSSRGRPHSYLRRARQHRVDGIVVMGVDRNDPEVEKLVRRRHPGDGRRPGRGRRPHELRRLGQHRRRAAGRAASPRARTHADRHDRRPEATKPGADRTLGYRAEMRELGLKIPRGYEIEGDFYPESGERAMQSLLELASRRPPCSRRPT